MAPALGTDRACHDSKTILKRFQPQQLAGGYCRPRLAPAETLCRNGLGPVTLISITGYGFNPGAGG
jgi:hypothetical protein